MAQKERNTDKRIDRVLNLVKAKFGFKNKSKAIAFLVRTYEQDFLEPELRPEYIKKLNKIRKGKYIKFNSINELYQFKISERLKTILTKLSRKDKSLYEQLMNKISEIANSYDLKHYKNLKYNLKDLKRVYIGHFVLVFRFDRKTNEITVDDFDHYDNLYK